MAGAAGAAGSFTGKLDAFVDTAELFQRSEHVLAMVLDIETNGGSAYPDHPGEISELGCCWLLLHRDPQGRPMRCRVVSQADGMDERARVSAVTDFVRRRFGVKAGGSHQSQGRLMRKLLGCVGAGRAQFAGVVGCPPEDLPVVLVR